MPPRESIRPRTYTDVYSLLLVLAGVFLFFSLALTWIELRQDYDFFGTAEAVVSTETEKTTAEPQPASVPAPAPAPETAPPAGGAE